MSPYTAADSSGVHADVASSRLAKLVSRHQAMSSLNWVAFPLFLDLVSKAGWTGVGVAGMTLTGCMPKSLRSRCLRPDAARDTVICNTACVPHMHELSCMAEMGLHRLLNSQRGVAGCHMNDYMAWILRIIPHSLMVAAIASGKCIWAKVWCAMHYQPMQQERMCVQHNMSA